MGNTVKDLGFNPRQYDGARVRVVCARCSNTLGHVVLTAAQTDPGVIDLDAEIDWLDQRPREAAWAMMPTDTDPTMYDREQWTCLSCGQVARPTFARLAITAFKAAARCEALVLR
jgi:hypothetical protein